MVISSNTKDPLSSVSYPSAYAVNLNFSLRFALLLSAIAKLFYLIYPDL